MSQHHRLFAGLVLVALIGGTPSAQAASSRRHKSKRSAPTHTSAPAARPAPEPEPAPTEDPPDAEPVAEPAPPAREEPVRARARPPAESADEFVPENPKRAARKVPAPADQTLSIEEANDDSAGRDAARIVAGRIEVAISAGIDAGRRHFTYSDPIGAAPRPYLLKLAPMLAFGIEAYPLASTGLPVLQDLGFRARVSRAFATDSSTSDGIAIQTSWTRFGGEVRQRILLRGRHPIELGVIAGVDGSSFAMTAKGDLGALVPSARTLALRFGADARIDVTRTVAVLAGGAYLSTTSRGEIYDRFRGPRVAGVDTELGGALALSPGLEARLAARYTRYFASFKPEVGDAAVAGGALDEQLQVGMGIRYAH
ncbi:MAG TPA: hypothetical protein VHU40_16590 [Polyangia bacterium]|nr:hypothetical protein [Polyangia bacterium]